MDEVAAMIGALAGILVGLVIVYVACRWIRQGRGKAQYDERQELIRGKAYKCAFYVTLLGISIALCTGDYIGKYVNISVVLFVVLCVGVLMYAGYCIFHDAYFALNSRPGRYAFFSVVVAAVNLVGGIVAFVNSRPSLTEYLPSGVVNILCGVMFMILGILFLAKQGMDRQEA